MPENKSTRRVSDNSQTPVTGFADSGIGLEIDTKNLNGSHFGYSDLGHSLRPPMNQDEFDKRYSYSRPKHRNSVIVRRMGKSVNRYYRPFLSCKNFYQTLVGFLPIIGWLPQYDWRHNTLNDIIGGLTVGIMHVPQGIGYAVLSKVPPIVGLYTSFFPPILYMLFGTSRHSSIGSFAVVSLMAGLKVEQLMSNYGPTHGGLINGTATASVSLADNPAVVISTTLALCVGLVQLTMGLLRMEILITYFSDQLVTGFSTAATFHVFIVQFIDLFGLYGLPKRSGAGNLPMKLYDIVTNIHKSNFITTTIGMSTLIFLVFAKDYLSPFLKRRCCSLAVPFELIIVFAVTALSALFKLLENFNVAIVGEIPMGLPKPIMPDITLLPDLFSTALSISIVAIAIHISLAKMFAKQMNYKVDSAQELYALGLSATLTSVFPAYPVSCSLGRTVVNVEAGTKTQLSSIFSSAFLAAIILYFGQYLRTLPMCVLSAIILVALKGMLYNFSDLCTLWPLSKIDFSIWVVSFVATVFWDVTEGLAVSICYALLTTVFRAQWGRWRLLANLNGTNDFWDAERYGRILRHTECVHKALALWESECDDLHKYPPPHPFLPHQLDAQSNLSSTNGKPNSVAYIQPNKSVQRHFVIDCSGFAFVDFMGVNALKEIFAEMKEKHILIYFSASKAQVRDLFEKSGFYQYVEKQNFYPTVNDAVEFAKRRLNSSSKPMFTDISKISIEDD